MYSTQEKAVTKQNIFQINRRSKLISIWPYKGTLPSATATVGVYRDTSIRKRPSSGGTSGFLIESNFSSFATVTPSDSNCKIGNKRLKEDDVEDDTRYENGRE